MAKKATKDKKSKNKSDKVKKAAASESTAPKIVIMKGGITPAALTGAVLATMEDDLRISKKQAADFVESLGAVVEECLALGDPVNLWHMAKLVPRLHTKGEREVNEVFGDPTSKKVKKKYPAKVTLVAKLGSRFAGKKGVEIIPNAAGLAKKVA